MQTNNSAQRGSHWHAIPLIALFGLAPALGEETKDKKAPAADLDPMIVSAMRTPRAASTVTSAVTVLDPEALQNQGIFQLRDALNQSPGVISTSTAGETGAVGTLLIRGTTTNYSQVVVDGLRLSDSSNPMGNFLASARTYDIGNLEILRGPQGAIYGGESIGGVLWMETPHGSGSPHGATTVEAGSFNSLSTYSNFQGQTRDLSYYLTGGYEVTDNDAPNQSFNQASTALRLEGRINPDWTLGTTFRAFDNYFENSGMSDEYVDGQLWTLYATGKISECWTARFHAGFHQESYASESQFGLYGTDLREGCISTDHEITLAENLRLLAGGFVSLSDYQDTIGTDQDQTRYGVHTALEWDPVEHLTTMAALRWEDYDPYGDELTWRLGSIYTIESTGTAIRGGVGSSFLTPTYIDLFGSSFGPGNPNLRTESALGWDLGIEQKIGSRHVAEVTYFSNQISDSILRFPAPPVNIPGETDTNGLEVGLRGEGMDGALGYRLAWTWLHESLADQPRNAATASVDWKPTAKALIGIGATTLSEHSWGGDPVDSYVVARLYGSYQLTDRVKLHARLENALNEDYELGSFFGTVVKGAGTGLYAGLTVDW